MKARITKKDGTIIDLEGELLEIIKTINNLEFESVVTSNLPKEK